MEHLTGYSTGPTGPLISVEFTDKESHDIGSHVEMIAIWTDVLRGVSNIMCGAVWWIP